MKAILLFATSMLVGTTVFCQNVGIGTTTPAFKLDVSEWKY